MGIGYKAFGFLSFGEGDGLRFTWLQIVWDKGFAIKLCDRGPDRDDKSRWLIILGLGLVWVYLSLPFLNWLDRELSEDGKSGFGDDWGFSYRIGDEWSSALSLDWGGWHKSISMPWAYDWHRTSYLMADGTWAHESKARHAALTEVGGRYFSAAPGTFCDAWHWKKQEIEPAQWRETYPYTYVLKNGTVQKRQATVTVEEREWRRRGWRWSRLGRKVRRTIDVQFSDEVGERSGSWKGGTIGCGYDLRPGETPLQCLRRMERDRVFR